MAWSAALWAYLATTRRSDRHAERKLARDIARGRIAAATRQERLCHAQQPRPRDGPVLWFHNGALGDAVALAELMRRLQVERYDARFLLTSDGQEGPNPNLPHGTERQVVPLDFAGPVARFLDHWQPDVAVFTDLDLRPALVEATRRRGVPMFLVNAHVTPRRNRWLFRWPGLARALFRGFERIVAADRATAIFLRRSGAPPGRIEVLGFLPDSTGALACSERDRALLARELGARPVWLAAAPSLAETDLVLTAHRQASRRAHRLLLVLVAESETDASFMTGKARDAGFEIADWAAGETPTDETQVLIADGTTELGLWYRLAPISFLGQTVIPGHGAARSPYEPAALGSAILHGPVTAPFAGSFAKLDTAGATMTVRNALELGNAVEMLISPDRAAVQAHAAWDVVSSGAEVTDRVIAMLLGALDAREAAA